MPVVTTADSVMFPRGLRPRTPSAPGSLAVARAPCPCFASVMFPRGLRPCPCFASVMFPVYRSQLRAGWSDPDRSAQRGAAHGVALDVDRVWRARDLGVSLLLDG